VARRNGVTNQPHSYGIVANRMVLNRLGSGFKPSEARNEKSERWRSLGERVEPHGKVGSGRFEKVLSEYYGKIDRGVETGDPTRGELVGPGLGWVEQALKLK
jgi:hypothetical protein